MHTTTTKSILGPMADSIAAIIVVISDAEMADAPMPDLTEFAKILDSQVLNLVNIGKQIISQDSADGLLKTEMAKGCEDGKNKNFTFSSFILLFSFRFFHIIYFDFLYCCD